MTFLSTTENSLNVLPSIMNRSSANQKMDGSSFVGSKKRCSLCHKGQGEDCIDCIDCIGSKIIAKSPVESWIVN